MATQVTLASAAYRPVEPVQVPFAPSDDFTNLGRVIAGSFLAASDLPVLALVCMNWAALAGSRAAAALLLGIVFASVLRIWAVAVRK